jgi:hypothetical protein
VIKRRGNRHKVKKEKVKKKAKKKKEPKPNLEYYDLRIQESGKENNVSI